MIPTLGPYTAAKFGVVALSEMLALELASVAPGVGVTVVCPGMIESNLSAAERNRPPELATGETIEVVIRGVAGRALSGVVSDRKGKPIAGATVNGSSTFLENPAISIVGNNIFLNYSGANTGNGPTTSIIDVTTPASGAPEPGTLTLLGAGLLGLGFRYKRRSA